LPGNGSICAIARGIAGLHAEGLDIAHPADAHGGVGKRLGLRHLGALCGNSVDPGLNYRVPRQRLAYNIVQTQDVRLAGRLLAHDLRRSWFRCAVVQRHRADRKRTSDNYEQSFIHVNLSLCAENRCVQPGISA
jgi:hypothetical protein